jgi:hypothetical protein
MIVAYASAFAFLAIVRVSDPSYAPPSGQIHICLRPNGAVAGHVMCGRESCRCVNGDAYVADYCRRGERLAPNTADANRARAAAAASGTLTTTTFHGRRFCVRYIPPFDEGIDNPSVLPSPNFCCGGAR